MKLKEIENKINGLERIVRDGHHYSRDTRIDRASSAFHTYSTYNADLDDETEDIIAKGNKLLTRFLDLKDKFADIAKKYVEVNTPYVNLLFEEISGQKKSNERIEKREIKKNEKESFMELCVLIRETLEKTNLVDTLINRENNALKRLGLFDFISTEDRENYKKELLSERSINNATSLPDQIRNQAMCLFWVNKISKAVEDCMLGYMIEKVRASTAAGKSKNQSRVSEEEKLIALARLDLIKSIYRYCDSRFGKNFDLSSDVDFEVFLNNEGVEFDFSDFLRYMTYRKGNAKDIPEMKKYFDSVPSTKRFYESLPSDFIEKISEIESRYNKLFAGKESSAGMTFIHDAFMFSQMNELKTVIYELKTELTAILIFILLLEKNMNPSPYCKVWGISSDKKISDSSTTSNVLYVELPGYIHPLMVHVEDILIDEINSTGWEADEYDGIFKGANSNGMESFLATHTLFRLTNKQKSTLKAAKKSKKAEVDKMKRQIDKMPDGLEKLSAEKVWIRECKYYRVIEYMEAMAKDKARNIGPEK